MYDNTKNKTGLQVINNDLELYKSIRDYFKDERQKTKLSYKRNEKSFGSINGGGMVSNILTSYKDGWTSPNKRKNMRHYKK